MKELVKYRLKLIREEETEYNGGALDSPETVAKAINEIFEMDTRPEEIFVMVALDTKKKPVGCFLVSQGRLDATVVHPREVFKRALMVNAHSIIVAHNHPSGSVKPSRGDVDITKTLRDAGEIMNIELLDHVIIGEDGKFYSFGQEGMLL